MAVQWVTPPAGNLACALYLHLFDLHRFNIKYMKKKCKSKPILYSNAPLTDTRKKNPTKIIG